MASKHNTDDRRMIKEERNLTATCATSLHGGRGRHHRRRWEARGAPAENLGELRCLAMVVAAAAAVVVSSSAPPEALMKALTILHPSLSLSAHTMHISSKRIQNHSLMAKPPSVCALSLSLYSWHETKALKEVCNLFVCMSPKISFLLPLAF